MPTQANDPHPQFFFHGFGKPTFTQVPDELFDELLAKLSGAELKVLLYIIRRTFGFKKESDSISLSQLVNGIRTRDGERLDSGTGLSKGAVAMAVKSLEAKGVLFAERDRTKEKGDVPTTYALRFHGDPVSNNRTGGSLKNRQARVQKSDTQQTVEQETVKQHTVPSNQFERQTLDIRSANSHFSRKRDFENKNDDKSTRTRSNHIDPLQVGGFTAVGEVVRTRREKTSPRRSAVSETTATPTTELIASSPSRRPSGRSGTGGRRGLADRATPDIAAVMQRVSEELHDGAERSSLGRAVRLWEQSRASEGNFIAAIYAAKKIATSRGDIEKKADGEAGAFGIRNRMPYFLRCLEDQLGLKPPPASSSV